MGADAVAIGQGVLVALGCNSDSYIQNGVHRSAAEGYAALGTARRILPSLPHRQMSGRHHDPGPSLEQCLQPEVGAKRLRNYLKTLNMELTTIARACGKQNVHHLEREDLVALTVEAAAMAHIPLAGTNWIPGSNGY